MQVFNAIQLQLVMSVALSSRAVMSALRWYIPDVYAEDLLLHLLQDTFLNTKRNLLQDKLIIYLRHTSPSAVRMYGAVTVHFNKHIQTYGTH